MVGRRVIILVMDSVGIGSAHDAHLYNDEGSNTLGHIALRHQLHIPNLTRLGLVRALHDSSGETFNLQDTDSVIGSYGYGIEVSKGKDTVSGHWEIAGCPVLQEWGYFTELNNSFPQELLDNILRKSNIQGYLGNCHASGTEIIARLGMEHIRTGFPIFYTSADSVFQVAAHEEHFGLENLYNLCQIIRKEIDAYNIGRVIARPFVGTAPDNFTRTSNRRDYAVPPTHETVLDVAKRNAVNVVAIGKTGDIFAHQGITDYMKSPWNQGNIEDTIKAMNLYATGQTLIFTNLADFDVLYGHRRDPQGYGEAINYFDQRLGEIMDLLLPEDLLIITADHGNDPTWRGTDHTRENVPILVYRKGIQPVNFGQRTTFADIGQSMASYLGLPTLQYGTSFINI